MAVVLLLVALGAFVARSILHDGLSANANPTALETALAHGARYLAMPSSAKRQVNPTPDSDEVRREGMLHFADHCAVCHANDGSGDTLYGNGMYPHPPDLRSADTQALADGELFWIIENGVRFTGMPAFAGHDDGVGSWKLVRFIRHLPKLSTEERMEMGRANPKSDEDRKEEQEEEEFLKGAPAQSTPSHEHHH